MRKAELASRPLLLPLIPVLALGIVGLVDQEAARPVVVEVPVVRAPSSPPPALVITEAPCMTCVMSF